MLGLFLSQLATASPGLPSMFLQSLLRCRTFSPAEGKEKAELALSHTGRLAGPPCMPGCPVPLHHPCSQECSFPACTGKRSLSQLLTGTWTPWENNSKISCRQVLQGGLKSVNPRAKPINPAASSGAAEEKQRLLSQGKGTLGK